MGISTAFVLQCTSQLHLHLQTAPVLPKLGSLVQSRGDIEILRRVSYVRDVRVDRFRYV